MLVKTILEAKGRRCITARKSTTLKDAMQLLIENKVSCLPVIDNTDHLTGIISDKDIFRVAYDTCGQLDTLLVEDCMTTNVIIGLPDDDISYIANIMTENRIRHVPIVQKDSLVGLISVGDVVKTQIEHIEVENRYLRQYIEGSYPG